MGAMLRALNSRGYDDIEAALHVRGCTSQAMREAITGWFAAWFSREPDGKLGVDPCQRLPYAIVNKMCKAIFAEYDSGLQETATPKLQWMDGVRRAYDAQRGMSMQWGMVGGEVWIKPVPSANGGLQWLPIRRDHVLVLGRASDGSVTDLATCEKCVVAERRYFTLVERRMAGMDGRLTIQNRLYESESCNVLGSPVPLDSLPQYANLAPEYTYATPIDGVGLVYIRMPSANTVDGSHDGISVYEPAMGLIHNIDRNEYQLGREFELGRMRIVASADLLSTPIPGNSGRKQLKDDLFVGVDDNASNVGITAFAPALRDENYERRRQAYLKAIENLLGIKRGILSDAEATEKTATEITSSAGDYSLSIIDFQRLWYDSLQDALRLADQIGRAYKLCDDTPWDPDALTVTWGNGVLYDADKEWTDRKEMVQMGLLKPELALAWKFDLPSETEADLEAIRQKYMPELADLER